MNELEDINKTVKMEREEKEENIKEKLQVPKESIGQKQTHIHTHCVSPRRKSGRDGAGRTLKK